MSVDIVRESRNHHSKATLWIFAAFLPLLFQACDESGNSQGLGQSDFPFLIESHPFDQLTTKSYHFVDLDGDLTQEQLIVSWGMNPNQSLVHASTFDGRTIGQTNLNPSSSSIFGFAADFTGDGRKEICVRTVESDTMFVTIVDIFADRLVGRFPVYPKPSFLSSFPTDVNCTPFGLLGRGTEREPLILTLFTSTNEALGFLPRGVSAFDLRGKEVWTVPTAAWPHGPMVADLRNDGRDEVFLTAGGVGNGVTSGEFDDSHAYLIGVSSDGQLLWDRMVLGTTPSYARAFLADYNNDGVEEIICYYNTAAQTETESFVRIVDPVTGRSLQQQDFDELVIGPSNYPIVRQNGQTYLLATATSGQIRLLDRGLNIVKQIDIGEEIHLVTTLDSDGDRNDEIALTLSNQTIILDGDLDKLALFDRSSSIHLAHESSGRERMFLVTQDHTILEATLVPNSKYYVRTLTLISSVLLGGVLLAFILLFALFHFRLYTTMTMSANHLATLVLTRTGRLLHANDAFFKFFEIDHGMKKGRTLTRNLSASRFATVSKFLCQISSSPRPIERHLDVDGAKGHSDLLARSYPIRVMGIRVGSLVVFVNITDSLKTDRAINWALVAQSLAHEMKTPLSTIWFVLERIRQKLSDSQTENEVHEQLESISEEIRRLDRFVKGFMKLANLNPPNLSPTDLNRFVDETLSSYRQRIPSTVVIETEMEPEIPAVSVDVNLFTTALTNLLDNAVTAMKGRGKLRLSSYLAQNLEHTHACLAIADTGCGIPESHQAKLFSPYFSRSERGTGLGLVITRKIIEDHGGTISFTTQENVGSEFVVRLPISRTDGGDHHA
jgi:nitrogen-specific signal transduction histidine kinase